MECLNEGVSYQFQASRENRRNREEPSTRHCVKRRGGAGCQLEMSLLKV